MIIKSIIKVHKLFGLTLCLIVGLLSIIGSGGGGGGSSSGGVSSSGSGQTLNIVWQYDVTADPNLTGFRFYNNDDKSLLLDTFEDLPSSIFNLTYFESHSQPATLTIEIPVADIVDYTYLGLDIKENMNVCMKAYVTLPDSTEIESGYSNVLTVQ